MNELKAVLPFFIILFHIHGVGYSGIEIMGRLGDIVMYFFFAMSGFGLTISYMNNEQYIKGFLRRSLVKLFIPYFAAFLLFFVYRWYKGVDQTTLFMNMELFSLVPASWYLWVLSYFYVFFFVVFRYVKFGNSIKVLMTCVMVMGFVYAAPYVGFDFYHYNRCPAFCVGMVFALLDNLIRTKFVRWHALFTLALLFVVNIYRGYRLDPFFYSTVLFLFMYSIRGGKDIGIIKFISSISLEMFIIQFLPIYIAMNDLQLTSTICVVPFVFLLDIILAYVMHVIVKRITKYFLNNIAH